MSTDDLSACRVLVVDDDPGTRAVLRESLEQYSFRVETAADAREMGRVLAHENIDVIVLDLMMPGEDGLSVCRRLSATGGPPVIMLTAMSGETDRIIGLELGADHYLGKPCSPRELIAHIRAVLRSRASFGPAATRPPTLGFLGWRVDLAMREIVNPDGALVNLTDGEFALLRAFLERPRRVLCREQLLEAARGPDSDSFDRAVDVQVSRIRRKLAGLPSDAIRTVRNEGYMFTLEVRRL